MTKNQVHDYLTSQGYKNKRNVYTKQQTPSCELQFKLNQKDITKYGNIGGKSTLIWTCEYDKLSITESGLTFAG